MSSTMLLSLLFASATLIPLGQDGELIDWGELPALPDSIGRAGAFVGTSGGALVVAGGANFPAGRPWDGHPKVWHRDAFVLTTPDAEWLHFQAVLPEQLAYGVTLQRGDEMIIAGGGNASRHTDAVAELTWTGRELQYTELPILPDHMASSIGVTSPEVNGLAFSRTLSCLDSSRSLAHTEITSSSSAESISRTVTATRALGSSSKMPGR
jgi:hypothetical protein